LITGIIFGDETLFYKAVKFERREISSHKTHVFHFLLSVYFLFVIIQFSYQIKLLLGLKDAGEAFAPHSPTQVTPMFLRVEVPALLTGLIYPLLSSVLNNRHTNKIFKFLGGVRMQRLRHTLDDGRETKDAEARAVYHSIRTGTDTQRGSLPSN
jgi:hypothetical protein